MLVRHRRETREREEMGNEKQTELGTDGGINWTQFEGSGMGGDFLKFGDKETHTIGIREIKPMEGKFNRKQADGTQKEVTVPQVGLIIDYLDGQSLSAPRVFATSAKYLVATIKEYHKSNMLYKWYFMMQRIGMDKQTKYTLIPVKERAGATPSQSKSPDGIGTYAN